MTGEVQRVLLVCLGGALGSGLRYLGGGWLQRRMGGGFPYGTLGVNLVGSFVIVAVLGLGLRREFLGPEARLFLGAGVLGGFTTYSAFTYETLRLFEERAGLALLYLGVTVLGCLGAGLLARALVRALDAG